MLLLDFGRLGFSLGRIGLVGKWVGHSVHRLPLLGLRLIVHLYVVLRPVERAVGPVKDASLALSGLVGRYHQKVNLKLINQTDSVASASSFIIRRRQP